MAPAKSSGCPYVAGPACWDCDGSCWKLQTTPAGPEQPEPCQGCYYVTGQMMDHDGTCDGLVTDADYDAARAAWLATQRRPTRSRP